MKSDSEVLWKYSGLLICFCLVTNMTAIIIGDIVVIKPYLSVIKWVAGSSVQMHCNKNIQE